MRAASYGLTLKEYRRRYGRVPAAVRREEENTEQALQAAETRRLEEEQKRRVHEAIAGENDAIFRRYGSLGTFD